MNNKLLTWLFGDGTMNRWISYILMFCGSIMIITSFFNEDMRWTFWFGTFSLVLGIGGYFNPPKDNNN